MFRCLHLLINSNLSFSRLFLLLELFRVFHSDTCTAFFYLNYMVHINKVVHFNFPIFFQQFCLICKLFMGKVFGVLVEYCLLVRNVCCQIQFTREKELPPNPTIMTKFTLELQKSCLKRDSTTTLNLLPMNSMQMTQNCWKNIGKLKETTLFQK